MDIEFQPHDETDPLPVYDRNCLLILDDNRSWIDYLSRCFERQQFKVLSHTCGEYGFQSALKSIPDCILLNTELIDMDGINLCQRLVDDPATCSIPVIMMGRPGEAAIIGDAKAAGCEFFVSKPVDPKVLLFLVNESIAQARSWICD